MTSFGSARGAVRSFGLRMRQVGERRDRKDRYKVGNADRNRFPLRIESDVDQSFAKRASMLPNQGLRHCHRHRLHAAFKPSAEPVPR